MINLDTKIEIKFIHLSFEPGTESRHSHDENQLLFFISGKGIEFIENRKFKITPGTFILIPEKKVHFFKSYSNKPSEILSIRFKLSHEVKNKITTDFFKKPYLYRSGKEDIE
ncbi:MAG: cupin domain-containing protein, partial [bacterium]|nr:cupin domain-containing protein [bacterium]MDW8164244.1 cupin domain-containing protein [Candidatus Omnitrophota bacterium]